ncbi:MAG: hypothetical protein LUC91_01265 [Prevotella sp.]|nr:hypothetical protein [Prevotella sp.]
MTGQFLCGIIRLVSEIQNYGTAANKVKEIQIMLNKTVKEICRDIITRFEVYEDNAGGLFLATFDDNGCCDYLCGEFEQNHEQLLACLYEMAAWNCVPAKDFEGNIDDSGYRSGLYNELVNGAVMVADNKGIYEDKMGNNAKFELLLSFD